MIDNGGGGRVVLPETILEQQEPDPGYSDFINPTVQQLWGIDGHLPDRPTEVNMKRSNGTQSSIFSLDMLTSEEIKRRTGFSDIQCMLCFASIICGGGMEIIITTCSKLNWI
jgi:hypothetical protein